jgi:hypothetical protein
MLRKINLMINGLTDYGQELEWWKRSSRADSL